ncbi:hypothetical protein L228DRAFT_240672 [Xylona heveae TC161]|uniref:GST N-terminal domain-containing protein n=1 Tax=Xylona heveae (strain CBS 132557 / TC161) TaxID=1328760 RepID=A0A165FGP6_XYLHT|nr:hypothetical protein L228DRAFT_240672 [Xylona heveae TC161]KZF20955.1 hypothetical protein L228DRAFT_240672 [Xylona heveae TC161]
MSFKLYGYERNPRTRIIRILVGIQQQYSEKWLMQSVKAEAEGIQLAIHQVVPRQGIGKDDYKSKFPLSAGKIPGLEGPDIQLTETLAIAMYLAKIANKSRLLGDGSIVQEAEVLMWMSWANQELLQTLARWFLPLIPSFTDPAPYSMGPRC